MSEQTLPNIGVEADIRKLLAARRLAPAVRQIDGNEYFLFIQKGEARRPVPDWFYGYEEIAAAGSVLPPDVIETLQNDFKYTDEEIAEYEKLFGGGAVVENGSVVLRSKKDHSDTVTVTKMDEGLYKAEFSRGVGLSLVEGQPGELTFIEARIGIEEIQPNVYRLNNDSVVGIMNHEGGVDIHPFLDAPGARGLKRRVVRWKANELAPPDYERPEGVSQDGDYWINPEMIAGTGHGSSQASSGRPEYCIITTDPSQKETADKYVDPTKVSQVMVKMDLYIDEKLGYHTVETLKFNV